MAELTESQMPTLMRTHTRTYDRAHATPRRLAVIAALGLAAAAACSGRERAKSVDADLGHDLELASTTGIELANRGNRGTQVVSAIEESPRSAPRHSASPKPTSAGRRRHKVAKKQQIDAPPATVMVADHEVAAPASTEPAAGRDASSNAPSPDGPNAGPAITPEPQPYPAGGGGDVGTGRGGGGGGVIGIIGAILRGGVGGVDRCDERDGHGRHGRRGGGDVPTIVLPGGVWNPNGGMGGVRLPSRGGIGLP